MFIVRVYVVWGRQNLCHCLPHSTDDILQIGVHPKSSYNMFFSLVDKSGICVNVF